MRTIRVLLSVLVGASALLWFFTNSSLTGLVFGTLLGLVSLTLIAAPQLIDPGLSIPGKPALSRLLDRALGVAALALSGQILLLRVVDETSDIGYLAIPVLLWAVAANIARWLHSRTRTTSWVLVLTAAFLLIAAFLTYVDVPLPPSKTVSLGRSVFTGVVVAVFVVRYARDREEAKRRQLQ